MATDYISQDVAVTIADYAADKHPYDKDTKKPETYSEYNRGWNDACDYIRERLEGEKPADVEPVRRGKWNIRVSDERTLCLECSVCGRRVDNFGLHRLLLFGEYGRSENEQ